MKVVIDGKKKELRPLGKLSAVEYFKYLRLNDTTLLTYLNWQLGLDASKLSRSQLPAGLHAYVMAPLFNPKTIKLKDNEGRDLIIVVKDLVFEEFGLYSNLSKLADWLINEDLSEPNDVKKKGQLLPLYALAMAIEYHYDNDIKFDEALEQLLHLTAGEVALPAFFLSKVLTKRDKNLASLYRQCGWVFRTNILQKLWKVIVRMLWT
jgi:hypothetical protein